MRFKVTLTDTAQTVLLLSVSTGATIVTLDIGNTYAYLDEFQWNDCLNSLRGADRLGYIETDNDVDAIGYGDINNYHVVTSGSNVNAMYIEDEGGTAYTQGLRINMKATGGDGNGALRPIHTAALADTGADLVELFGGSFYATVTGGAVSDNLHGVMGWSTVSAAGAAPVEVVSGMCGILTLDEALSAKVCGAVCADLKYGTGGTGADGAFVATRSGSGTDVAVGAAFKVKQLVADTIPAFLYGADLYTEHTEGYTNCDIRLQTQACIMSGTADPTNGATGATFAEIGSIYLQTTDGKLFQNTGTKASPTWTQIT